MVTRTVVVDLDDFETEDLCAELELRGYAILDKDDPFAMSPSLEDDIYNLYRDYIDGLNFDRKLKQFFERHTNRLVP